MAATSFSFSATAANGIVSEIDAAIWRAVAGSSVKIPNLNSNVYYFPQGHLENSSSDSEISNHHNFAISNPLISCRVISVRFLCNPTSDQVLVKFLLQPIQRSFIRDCSDELENDDQNDVVSFAKVLTQSDAHNGGGFSIPKSCADSVLPPLDFAADQRPVQNLTMRDVAHNNIAWEFRHIYRGTPRRHLFTTGWSKFVNGKRLVAGDSVVFIRRKSTNELFIGVRRGVRRSDCASGLIISSDNSVAAALLAMEKAARGMLFEVVYYPRVWMPDFVVSAKKVEDSLIGISWRSGMQVRIPAKIIDDSNSSRMTHFHGRIGSVSNSSNCTGPWPNSPWRMLQINWDDPKILQNMKRVSPWQIEHVPSTSEPDSASLPSKKLKAAHKRVTPPDGDQGQFPFTVSGLTRSIKPEFHFPMSGLTRSIEPEPLNSAAFHYSPFPSGLVGRDHMSISNSLITHKPHQKFIDILKNNVNPQPKTVSTVLDIGSSRSESLTPFSHGSVRFSGSDNSSPNSFQLFGKIIQASAVPIEK